MPKLYTGPLNYKKMSPEVLKAYHTWANQRSRCNNPRDVSYHVYGGRGIRQEYSSREFVGWYLEELEKCGLTTPTVGRIDHNKNYRFDNIKLEESSENSRDAMNRYWKKPGPKPKTCTKVELFCHCCNKSVRVFQSVDEAAKFLKVHRSSITVAIRNNSKLKKYEISHFGLRSLSKPRNNIRIT